MHEEKTVHGFSDTFSRENINQFVLLKCLNKYSVNFCVIWWLSSNNIKVYFF